MLSFSEEGISKGDVVARFLARGCICVSIPLLAREARAHHTRAKTEPGHHDEKVSSKTLFSEPLIGVDEFHLVLQTNMEPKRGAPKPASSTNEGFGVPSQSGRLRARRFFLGGKLATTRGMRRRWHYAVDVHQECRKRGAAASCGSAYLAVSSPGVKRSVFVGSVLSELGELTMGSSTLPLAAQNWCPQMASFFATYPTPARATLLRVSWR